MLDNKCTSMRKCKKKKIQQYKTRLQLQYLPTSMYGLFLYNEEWWWEY